MEKKQLNLNQPLLSVRRFTSTIASESDNYSSATLPYLASYKSELTSGSGPVRNAGAVPFQWEKTPGKPKDISVIEREKEGGSDSDDEDESFQNARDTLSRTESFFMRSSMSSDDREVLVRPDGRFSSNEKGRDFMIDQFLPAAKAVASDTPQCAPTKAGFGQGQQKQMWKIGSSKNKVQSNAGCGSTVSPFETRKEEHARPSYRRGCDESLVCESPAVEKTLYVDFIHRAKFETNHKGDDFEDLKRDSDFYKNLSVDSPFLICSENPISEKMDSEKLGIQGSDLVSISSRRVVECKRIDYEKLIKDSNFHIKRQPLVDREQTMEYDMKIDLESQCGLTLGHQELTGATSLFEIPLLLPSLKAPSESWLTRTLPAISTKNTSSKPKPCCKYIFKTASLYPKLKNNC